MTYKVDITNITYNRLKNYFPEYKCTNDQIRELFKIALSKCEKCGYVKELNVNGFQAHRNHEWCRLK
jgi:hypothetical protein